MFVFMWYNIKVGHKIIGGYTFNSQFHTVNNEH